MVLKKHHVIGLSPDRRRKFSTAHGEMGSHEWVAAEGAGCGRRVARSFSVAGCHKTYNGEPDADG